VSPDTFLPRSSTARWIIAVTSLRILSICAHCPAPSRSRKSPPAWTIALSIHPLTRKSLQSSDLLGGPLCRKEFSATPDGEEEHFTLRRACNATIISSGGIGWPNVTPSWIPIFGRYLYGNDRCSGISLSKPVNHMGMIRGGTLVSIMIRPTPHLNRGRCAVPSICGFRVG